MMPAPLQRLDRYYAHIDGDAISNANRPGLLTRVFGKAHEPIIPYTLKNTNAAQRFPDYRSAMAAIGLGDDDLNNCLKPGAANLYTEPKSDPEGRGQGRHLKWSAYVSPDFSHVVLEIGSPYYLMGFCFARDGDDVVLDQMCVGDVDTHYIIDTVADHYGAQNLRKTMMEVATSTIQGLRSNPKGSEARFSGLAAPVIQYIKMDMEMRLRSLRTQQALLETQANLIRLSSQFDTLHDDLQELSAEVLPMVQKGLESVERVGKLTQDGLQKIEGQLNANAESARVIAEKLTPKDGPK